MVTIADVARHAGVSPSTVSYVLSGKRTISEATRLRVESAIQRLGYLPHAGARALASSRANVIALVVPLRTDMHVPTLMKIAMAIVTEARAHHHDVLLLTNDEGTEGLLRVARSALVDAVVVMDVELHDARLSALRDLGLPSVLIGVPADTSGLTCVDLDFTAAAELCVDHLAGLGHREIALLAPPRAVLRRETGFAVRTVAGFRAAARRNRMRFAVLPGDPVHTVLRQSIHALFQVRPRLTGLVVHNELVIHPLLETLRGLGREVPKDVSVIAMCPADLAAQVSPRLTTVPIPAEEMARSAVELLVKKLDNATTPQTTLLSPALLPGASVTSPH